MKGRSRHLSIFEKEMNIAESSSKAQTHSIILFDGAEMSKLLISSFVADFKLLRTLDLGKAHNLTSTPEELGNLWHLRYLSLRKTKVNTLPKSIGKLCNLQTLDLRFSLVHDLPVEINRLLNLRHFLAYSVKSVDDFNPNFDDGVKMHGNIGCLKALRKLKYIEVDHDTGLIQQLESLEWLQKLGIKKLRRENGPTLCLALEKMKCLQRLTVCSKNKEEYLDLQAMSNPPPLLQHLYLNGPLAEFPQWFPKLTSLRKIHLNWSRLGDDALEVLGALPNLLKLRLHDAYNGQKLHFKRGCFLKLKVLLLQYLMGLDMLTIEIGALPLLEELDINSCPNLKGAPSGINFLRNLKLVRFFDIQYNVAMEMLNHGGSGYWNNAIVIFFYAIGEQYQYQVYKLGELGLIKL